MGRPFAFDGRWVFPVSPAVLWDALSRTERFPEWWSWLRILESGGLVAGTVSRCVVRPPLPYSLALEVTIVEVEPRRLVRANVSGDLDGPARLDLGADPEGSEARLSWELQVRAPLLQVVSNVARPLMEWGQDWVIDTGVRQFRRRALRTPPENGGS